MLHEKQNHASLLLALKDIFVAFVVGILIKPTCNCF